VVIDRDRVTLRSAGGDRAVLESAVNPFGPSPSPTIDIRYAQDVILEDLELRKSWIGVRVLYSGVSVRHGLLHSSTFGLSSETSNVLVTDSEFRGDTDAVTSESADRMELRGCSIEDCGFGAFAAAASSLAFEGGSIRNCSSGIIAATAANVSVDSVEFDFSIFGTADALLITEDAGVWVSNARMRGQYSWITIERGGTLRSALDGLSTEGPVQLREGGKLFTLGGSLTDVWLSDLAVASIRGSSIAGTLGCLPGSDALCPLSTIERNLGCASCAARAQVDQPRLERRRPDRAVPDFRTLLLELRRAKANRLPVR